MIVVVRTVVARMVVGWVRAVRKLGLEVVREVKVSLCEASWRRLDAVCWAFDLRSAACCVTASVGEWLLFVVSVADDDQNLGHGMLVTAHFERWSSRVAAWAS